VDGKREVRIWKAREGHVNGNILGEDSFVDGDSHIPVPQGRSTWGAEVLRTTPLR